MMCIEVLAALCTLTNPTCSFGVHFFTSDRGVTSGVFSRFRFVSGTNHGVGLAVVDVSVSVPNVDSFGCWLELEIGSR